VPHQTRSGRLSGNVWEWTRSLWGPDWQEPAFGYPYKLNDGREDLQAPSDTLRVQRGGAFWDDRQGMRCAYRDGNHVRDCYYLVGFRVVVTGLP